MNQIAEIKVEEFYHQHHLTNLKDATFATQIL
jgi:hypothetical protein